MQIEPFQQDLVPKWDEFVITSDDTWLFHTTDWLSIESAENPSRSFLVQSHGAIQGVCPLYVGQRRYARIASVRILHTGHARSGPALAPGLSRKERTAVYRRMLAHIDSLARAERADALEIRLASLAPRNLPPLRPAVNPLTALGPFSPLRYGHSFERPTAIDKIVPLERSEDQLWMDLDDDCRKAVRKAKKSGVTVVTAASRDDVAAYHRLHVDNYRRTGAISLPLAHFQRLWDRFFDKGFLRLFLAEYQDQRIAGMLVLRFGEAATYWAGSSDHAYQHVRPNNLLMWHAMLWARDHGCRWFELGPIFPAADPASKMSRIGRFKDSFGGECMYLFEGAKHYRAVKVALIELLDSVAADCVHRLQRWRSER
jgi:CelD/BcsL family acetyltransferase involved in cellulose biosynthesis